MTPCSPRDQFFDLLHSLHVEAGEPSFASLEKAADQECYRLRPRPVGQSTKPRVNQRRIREWLTGQHVPDENSLYLLVAALYRMTGIDPGQAPARGYLSYDDWETLREQARQIARRPEAALPGAAEVPYGLAYEAGDLQDEIRKPHGRRVTLGAGAALVFALGAGGVYLLTQLDDRSAAESRPEPPTVTSGSSTPLLPPGPTGDSQQASLRFTSPADASGVPHLVTIEGVASLPPGRQLWLIMKTPEEPLFHVTTREPIPVAPGGHFSSISGVGRGACDIGRSQTLFAVHAPTDGQIAKQIHALPTGDYLHIPLLPPDAVQVGPQLKITLSSFSGGVDRCGPEERNVAADYGGSGRYEDAPDLA